ncbi:MAG: nucleotidyltransferase family protein [Synergistetes bacterium]|nr:MAG: putative nucleotidyltransferase [bacterium 42_11]MBC7330832.1 nucleotidyltransferase family protein [Synergistota bacterium]
MKTLDEIIKILSERKDELRKKYKIKEIKIFGSYVKGEQKESSDIDIIVDFEEFPTFIEFMRIQEELEKILGVKVDLLTEESISPFIKPYIKEVVAI